MVAVLPLVKEMEQMYVDLVVSVEVLEVQEVHSRGATFLLVQKSEEVVVLQEEVAQRQKVFEKPKEVEEVGYLVVVEVLLTVGHYSYLLILL